MEPKTTYTAKTVIDVDAAAAASMLKPVIPIRRKVSPPAAASAKRTVSRSPLSLKQRNKQLRKLLASKKRG